MSTEQQQTVDHELLEQTKNQIQTLVAEIDDLAKSELGRSEYFHEFLTRVVQALAAVGGAVWMRGDSGGLELEYQINLRETRLAESQEDQVRHGMLLNRVMQNGEGLLVPPHTGSGDDNEAGNPTDFLLVLGALRVDQQVAGVIEVFQRPGTKPNTQRGYLRFVAKMCDYAGNYLKTRQLRQFSHRQALWSQLEQFTRSAHLSLDPRETAYTISNEGRRLIECDRVSVAIRRGGKCRIEAVSGQDTFDKRSNTVLLLNDLATAAVAADEAVWYRGDTTDMAPQVEEAVQAYVDDSHSKMVAVLPLKKPSPDGEEDKDQRPFGALIVEQIEDSRVRDGFMQRVEVVCEHSAVALGNSLEHNELFLMPLWRTLGKTKVIVAARNLPKTITVAVVLLVALVILFTWPRDFTLEGSGELEPIAFRNVFSPHDGHVEKIFVQHGQTVQPGDDLVQLRNTDLDVALTNAIGELDVTQKQIAATSETELRHSNLSEVERNRLRGERLEAEEKARSLQRQIDLLREKKEQLLIKSPIAGQVITWEVDEILENRPIQRGQKLLGVANPSQGYQLEVRMPEDRIGHIAKAQKEFGEDLLVSYILKTDPGRRYEGRIKEIEYSAEVRGEEGNTVLLKVAIDDGDLPSYLKPGASATAMVHCGRVPVGYYLFHDLFNWVRSRIIFPYF